MIAVSGAASMLIATNNHTQEPGPAEEDDNEEGSVFQH